MGLIDLLAKLSGTGDVLGPIRTAGYAMLTESSEAGFSRIAGAYSEASAFGGASLACLAFCYAYWRRTGSRFARGLSLILLVLLILSTSSTAYVGLVILTMPVAFSLIRSFVLGRLDNDELAIVVLVSAGILVGLAVSVLDEHFFDPFVHLIDTAVVNKSNSASGQERTYWNIKSLQSFVDTSGLGVGFGSSRASSWPIAVVSQLGFVGALMMATLLAVVVRGLGRLGDLVDPETAAVVASVRACAMASILAGSLVSGTADPGMLFFIALAVVSATRVRARRNAYAASATMREQAPESMKQEHHAPGHALP
jgi:hypothetical protein